MNLSHNCKPTNQHRPLSLSRHGLNYQAPSPLSSSSHLPRILLQHSICSRNTATLPYIYIYTGIYWTHPHIKLLWFILESDSKKKATKNTWKQPPYPFHFRFLSPSHCRTSAAREGPPRLRESWLWGEEGVRGVVVAAGLLMRAWSFFGCGSGRYSSSRRATRPHPSGWSGRGAITTSTTLWCVRPSGSFRPSWWILGRDWLSGCWLWSHSALRVLRLRCWFT